MLRVEHIVKSIQLHDNIQQFNQSDKENANKDDDKGCGIVPADTSREHLDSFTHMDKAQTFDQNKIL